MKVNYSEIAYNSKVIHKKQSIMSEISIKGVCCTCLSTDRKLGHLYKILDGINLLYMLLSHDPEAYKEGFYKEAASLLVCWECSAVIHRVKRFRTQVCVAQKRLTAIAEGRKVNPKTFSCLKIVHDTKPHYQFQSGFITENFIDCGPVTDVKHESDSDDIPLSAFYCENIDSDKSDNVDKDPDNSNMDPDKSSLTTDKSNLRLDNSYMKPDSDINADKKKLPDKSNIYCDNSDMKSDNTNLQIDNSNTHPDNSDIKPGKIKANSKKRTKMKYRKYFTVTTMNEEEMLKSVEKRKMDLFGDAAFKCETCIIVFKTEDEFVKHNEELHSQGNTSQCDICHAHIEDLPTHRQAHYHRYSCMLCTHIAYIHTDIATHIKHEHYEICYGKRKNLKKIVKLDSEELKYPCPECDFNFHNKDLRWKHIQKAHREGFKCSSCDKKFAFKNNLERHERIHSGPLPREECPICHKMIRIDLLKVHSRIHTDRQKYTCVECDKHFVSRETYESHLKYAQAHATVEVCRHKCGMCDKRYRSRGELRDHINYQHKGQAEHKCPVCNKGLATKRCIRRHVRRAHEGIKESAKDKICQQCGRAFRDKKGLIEHERVHSGARPLACGACGRAFRQRAALHAHMRRMHGNT